MSVVMLSNPVIVVRAHQTYFQEHEGELIPLFYGNKYYHTTWGYIHNARRYAEMFLQTLYSPVQQQTLHYGTWRVSLYLAYTESDKWHGVRNVVYKLLTKSRWDNAFFKFPNNTWSGFSLKDLGLV